MNQIKPIKSVTKRIALEINNYDLKKNYLWRNSFYYSFISVILFYDFKLNKIL